MRVASPRGFHRPPVHISACRTGTSVEGAMTSSRSAPETANTFPVGKSTLLEYQRGLFMGSFGTLVERPSSTVTISVRSFARYEPGDVPIVPPAIRKRAFLYGGFSGSITDSAPLRAPYAPIPLVAHAFASGS